MLGHHPAFATLHLLAFDECRPGLQTSEHAQGKQSMSALSGATGRFGVGALFSLGRRRRLAG
jgi:hypothetical protein